MVTTFSDIPSVLEDIKQGKMIVLVDDEKREYEGDLVCAAEKITPEIVNFMATHGRGMICFKDIPKRCGVSHAPSLTNRLVLTHR